MGTLDNYLSQAVDPGDFTGRYNTSLSPADEAAFQTLISKDKKLAGDLYDYDVRGWWKAGGSKASNGHGPDTFKKPNHPTFSDQSIYSGGMNQGGSWVGDDYAPSATNMHYHEPKELQNYFARVEPQSKILAPSVK